MTAGKRLLPSEAAAQALAAQRRAEDRARQALRRQALGKRERPPLWLRDPALRLPRQEATLRHLQSVYPLQADPGFGVRGPFLGVSTTSGDAGWYFDPFELYAEGVLTNPNVIVFGKVGFGKSATVSAFLARERAVYGDRRMVVIVDPKGEYGPLAAMLGLPVVRLQPGGRDRLNPMDPHPGDPEGGILARQTLAGTLVSGVLHRPLTGLEDAALSAAVEVLAGTDRPFGLVDLVGAVCEPPEALCRLVNRPAPELARDCDEVVLALQKLCGSTLRGMFDGSTTIPPAWTDGPGIVLDLSAVFNDDEALPLVMLAATSWLSAILRRRSDRRVLQVIDEAWAAVRYGARYFQAALKLSRAYGVSTWLICHRPSDLTAQADDGTADAKIAAGLLSDVQTRVLLRSDLDDASASLLGLGEHEVLEVGRLVKGRALWRVDRRASIVQVVLSPTELAAFNTDAAMVA